MALLCETCDVQISSEIVMQAHVQGKKHIRLSKQREQAEKSIFVRGFKFGTDDSALKQYFSKFGSILDVFLDREKGQFAIVQFSGKHEVEKVMMQRDHWLFNCRLTIKPRLFKPVKPAKKTSEGSKKLPIQPPDVTDHQQIFASLQKCQNVEEQIQQLKSSLQLSQFDLSSRRKFCSMLSATFQKFFPGSWVHPFGSSVNGFGVQGCDMDLFLDLNIEETVSENEEYYIDKEKLPYVGDIPSLRELLKTGKVSLKVFQTIADHEKMRLISRILSHCVPGCSEVFTITTARCPVIKFSHELSGYRCDLSMNNRLALHNTRLLQLYTRVHPPLVDLMLVIRYWAKMRQLAGNPVSGPRLTNYALGFLVIFYLQNSQPPALPDVQTLAHMADESERYTIEGWDCSFTINEKKVTSSGKPPNLRELLTGFFSFYSEALFESVVLCPRTARSVDVAEFIETGNHQFKISHMNMQDPFVLDHNITANINEKTRNKLVSDIQSGYRICTDESFWRKPEVADSEFGLCHLFSESEDQSKGHVASVKHENLQNDQEIASSGASSVYEFSVVLKHANLTESFLQKLKNSTGKKHDYREAWIIHTSNFIKQVFSEALRFDCCVSGFDTGIETMRSCQSTGSMQKQGISLKRLSPFTNTETAQHKKSKIDDEKSKLAASSEGNNTGNDNVKSSDCKETCPNSEENSQTSAVTGIDEEKSAPGSCIPKSQYVNPTTQDQHSKENPPNDAFLRPWQLQCSSKYRVWMSRKKVFKSILSDSSNHVSGIDGLKLESIVTDAIMKEQEMSESVVLGFTVNLLPHNLPQQTSIVLSFSPLEGAKEFSCFYLFLKTYLTKLVEKSPMLS